MSQIQNKMIFDDCLNIVNQIEDSSIDLILTDPPYNCLNKKIVDFETNELFLTLENDFLRILKPNGILLTFASWQLWHKLLNEWSQIKFCYELIISRTNWYAGPYSKRPVNAHEYLLMFCNNFSNSYFNEREIGQYKDPYIRGFNNGLKSKAHSNNQDREQIFSQSLDGFRKPTSIVSMRTKNHFKFNERTDHPTQKDILLIEKLIKAYCPENGYVFDPFGGVGTTAIASEKTNRNFIVCEIDQKWENQYIKLKEGVIN